MTVHTTNTNTNTTDTNTNTTDTTDTTLNLPSISAVALATLADVGGFGESINDGIVLTRSNGTTAPPTVAQLPYTSEGLSFLGGVPFDSCSDLSAGMLLDVRAQYKAIDPKHRRMGKKPSGSVVVKEMLSAFAGSLIDHKDANVSAFRANVWAIAPADPALDPGAPEGTASAPVRTDDGATVYIPFKRIDRAVECNALSAALRFLTAADSLQAPFIKKMGKLCMIPSKTTDAGVEYKLVKMVSMDDVAVIMARLGWRTPGRGNAQIILPTVDAAVKKAVCEDHGEAMWDRVYVANKAAVVALAGVKMEAVRAILGGKPPILTARAARAVETGEFYAEVLRSMGRADLISASRTLGAINGLFAATADDASE